HRRLVQCQQDLSWHPVLLAVGLLRCRGCLLRRWLPKRSLYRWTQASDLHQPGRRWRLQPHQCEHRRLVQCQQDLSWHPVLLQVGLLRYRCRLLL
ncbi:hypothetical protein IWQ60_003569, partial [Tieghemiomyces parasiticus]